MVNTDMIINFKKWQAANFKKTAASLESMRKLSAMFGIQAFCEFIYTKEVGFGSVCTRSTIGGVQTNTFFINKKSADPKVKLPALTDY